MKKFFLLLCLGYVFALCACGGNGELPSGPPLRVAAGEVSITPYQHFAYEFYQEGHNVFTSDGTWVGDELPQLAEEDLLPELSYGDGLTFFYGDSSVYRDIYLFDQDYQQLDAPVNTTALSTLDSGTYYVGILVDERGRDIQAAPGYEYTGWVCVFRLIVP